MIYIATPISEKPEKNGYYFLLIGEDGRKAYWNGEEWRDYRNVPQMERKIEFDFWLKPVEGVVMTEEEIAKEKRKEYLKGYEKGLTRGGIAE